MITPATAEEIEPLAILASTIIDTTPVYNARARREERRKYGADSLAGMAAMEPGSVLVARVDGVLAGFAFSRYDDGMLWISWVGVATSFRGQGLARELLRAVEHTARGRGCHALWCDCRADNTASVALLGAAGYRRIAELPDHWYGQDFILWRKDAGDPHG